MGGQYARGFIDCCYPRSCFLCFGRTGAYKKTTQNTSLDLLSQSLWLGILEFGPDPTSNRRLPRFTGPFSSNVLSGRKKPFTRLYWVFCQLWRTAGVGIIELKLDNPKQSHNRVRISPHSNMGTDRHRGHDIPVIGLDLLFISDSIVICRGFEP